TGGTTAVSSPSPDPPSSCASPTAPAECCTRGRWPAHPANPHRRCRRVPDPPVNAPTGGGITPSNPNHHQNSTNFVGAHRNPRAALQRPHHEPRTPGRAWACRPQTAPAHAHHRSTPRTQESHSTPEPHVGTR